MLIDSADDRLDHGCARLRFRFFINRCRYSGAGQALARLRINSASLVHGFRDQLISQIPNGGVDPTGSCPRSTEGKRLKPADRTEFAALILAAAEMKQQRPSEAALGTAPEP
jgi:hypothetical protein